MATALVEKTYENALAVIEQMKKTGATEMALPKSLLTVVRNDFVKENDFPLQRIGDFTVVQRGL